MCIGGMRQLRTRELAIRVGMKLKDTKTMKRQKK